MKHQHPQKGFSLVELMVALAIGMLIILGVLYVYVSSRASFTTNDAAARVQEDARFALETLTREIRMAGYTGCANSQSITPTMNALAATYSATFAAGDGIQVYKNDPADNSWAPSQWVNPTLTNADATKHITHVAGTDVVVVKRLGSCMTPLTGNMGTDNANIQVGTNPCGWAKDDLLAISDCTATDIFAATTVSGGSVTIAHASNANKTSKLSKVYGTDALVGKYQEAAYFIGLDTSINPAQPALFEVIFNGRIWGDAQVVAANVFDLRVPVNLDTDGDGDVDSLKQSPSAANWKQIASVSLQFSVRSEDASVGTGDTTYKFNGANVTDRRIRKIFNTTIGIRNRLP